MICPHCGQEMKALEVVQTTPKDVASTFFRDSCFNDGIYKLTIEHFVSKGYDRSIVTTELQKFCAYWMEVSMNGKKQRWEQEKFFDVKRRIITWLSRVKPVNQYKTKQDVLDESKIQNLIARGLAQNREDAISQLS